MEQPSTNAIPPKDSNESSGGISSDEKEALLFGGTIFILVCISWYLGIQVAIIAILLGAIGVLVLIALGRIERACAYMKEYREAIDIHSDQLNILLDERGRARVERGEEWSHPPVTTSNFTQPKG